MSVVLPDFICCYVNTDEHVQAIRFEGSPERQLERIVFPRQQIFFVAPSGARLEVSNLMAGAMQTESISCQRLQVRSCPDRALEFPEEVLLE